MKKIFLLLSTLIVSFTSAEQAIDPNLSTECSQYQQDLISSNEGKSSYEVSKNTMIGAGKCISSELDNFAVIKSVTKELFPESSSGSLAILGTYGNDLAGENVVQHGKEAGGKSLLEKLLVAFFSTLFTVLVGVLLFTHAGSLVDLARFKRRDVKKEALLTGVQGGVSIILLAPLFGGIPLIVYLIVGAAIIGLAIFYVFLTIFTLWMVPESFEDTDIVKTIESDLRVQVDTLIENSLSIQTCDITSRKNLQVLEANTLFYNSKNKVQDYEKSKTQQCLTNTKKAPQSWNGEIAVLQDDYSYTSKECFYDSSVVYEYECGRTLANLQSSESINTDLIEFYKKYNDYYQLKVREVANALVEFTCATRDDLDSKNDPYNYQRYCADQDITGHFKATESGDIATYEKSDSIELADVSAQLQNLKDEFYNEFLSIAKAAAKTEVTYTMSRQDLLNLGTSIVYMFERESRYEQQYAESIKRAFNGLQVKPEQLVSFANKTIPTQESGLRRDNLSNTLQKDEKLEENLKTIINSSSESAESSLDFIGFDIEKITIGNLLECNEKECDKAPVFAPKLYADYAGEVMQFSSKVYLSAIAIEATLKAGGMAVDGLKQSAIIVNALKTLDSIKAYSFLSLIISVSFELLIVSTIVAFVCFGLLVYIMNVVKSIFEIPIMIVFRTLFSQTETFNTSDITKRFVYILVKPALIGLSLMVIFILMSFIVSIISVSLVSVLDLFISTTNIVSQFISFVVQVIVFMIMLYIAIKEGKQLSATIERSLGIEVHTFDYSEMLVGILVTHLIYNKSNISKI
ncbi:hypothetical protein [Marinobacterium iners]|uniref:hypothetical protein n=1 Tax=Marinobacterium iners TaxID=48076 RepID=UPI001A8C3152|nr:hypothetical protein [Marinobacterium iners]